MAYKEQPFPFSQRFKIPLFQSSQLHILMKQLSCQERLIRMAYAIERCQELHADQAKHPLEKHSPLTGGPKDVQDSL